MIRIDTENLQQLTKNLSDFPKNSDLTTWIFRGITGQHNIQDCFVGSWSTYEASWSCYETKYALDWFEEFLEEQGFQDKLYVPDYNIVQEMESYWEQTRDWDHCRIFGVSTRIQYICSFLHTLRFTVLDTGEALMFPCFDDITRAYMVWKTEYKDAACPLWVIVGFQILVETGETLRRHSPNPFDDLRAQSQKFLDLLRRYTRHPSKEASERLDGKNMPPVYSVIPTITRCILRSDSFRRAQQKSGIPSINTEALTRTDGMFHTFLAHSPILCGIQSWWLEQIYRYFEWWAVEIHESIAPAAFLYISMRRLGLVAKWRDMEFVSQFCPGIAPCPLLRTLRTSKLRKKSC